MADETVLAIYYELRHGVKVIVGKLIERDGAQVYIELKPPHTCLT